MITGKGLVRCHNCRKDYAYRAWPNHRAAHRRRKESVTATTAQGTFTWDYRDEVAK